MRKQASFLKMTVFDSSLAHFRITVESRVTSRRQDNSIENRCYIDNNGNATINPNIYLVFTYKSENREENKSLYTSYPQLYSIRSAMSQIKDLLLSDDTYSNEGVLEVKPQYKDPVVVANIGKDNKWISFNLVAVSTDEGLEKERGVAIQISGANELTSVLSKDEFMTVYTIVSDIDLASLQLQFGLFTLLNDDVNMIMNNGGYQQPYQPAPQYGAPQQGGYGYGNGGYRQSAPRYNNNNYQSGNSYQRGSYGRSTGAAPAAPRSANYQQPQTPAQPQSSPAPAPRSQNSQIVNMKAVEETPVEVGNWDDDLTDSIFDN